MFSLNIIHNDAYISNVVLAFPFLDYFSIASGVLFAISFPHCDSTGQLENRYQPIFSLLRISFCDPPPLWNYKWSNKLYYSIEFQSLFKKKFLFSIHKKLFCLVLNEKPNLKPIQLTFQSLFKIFRNTNWFTTYKMTMPNGCYRRTNCSQYVICW